MNANLELLFFCALVIMSGVVLIDFLFLSRRKVTISRKLPTVVSYARSFLPILLMVFAVRSFAFEARLIPSGSLKPTLLVGDFILVNKFEYGIRLPVIHKKIFSLHEPKRGDIVVFRPPPSEPVDLIKRVVGVPGDHISYINKTLYINGKKAPTAFEKFDTDEYKNLSWEVAQFQENLLGIKHSIYQIPNKSKDDFYEVVVPPGKYFMMGDNRDDSADSRYWGFMPEENIIGKATRVLVSCDSIKHPVRWERFYKKII